MLLHIFGTCSGTEPTPGRRHTAFAFELGERLYWFDAGEGCAYTAHVMGVDLLRLRKVVISHPHIDHTGGLANLLWTVRKLVRVQKRLPEHEIELLLPDLRIWDSVAYLSGAGEEIHVREYEDGLLFDDDGFRVTALHNRHIPREDGAPWRSFGFLIECEGRRIVYSGDTKGIDDFAPLMPGCDLLLMETGHHHPPEVALELLERGIFPGKLAFLHHGRDFLDRYDEQVRALDEIVPGRYVILDDATTMEV